MIGLSAGAHCLPTTSATTEMARAAATTQGPARAPRRKRDGAQRGLETTGDFKRLGVVENGQTPRVTPSEPERFFPPGSAMESALGEWSIIAPLLPNKPRGVPASRRPQGPKRDLLAAQDWITVG